MTGIRRTLLFLAAALVLPLAAACGSDSASDQAKEQPAAGPPEAAADVVDSAVDDEPEVTTDPAEIDEPEATSSSADFGVFSMLMGGLPGLDGDLPQPQMSDDVDPSLSKALIQAEDLPDEMSSFGGGEFSFVAPTDQGDVEIAMSMFFSGDMMASEGPFSGVMSAVAVMPPDMMTDLFAEMPSDDDLEAEMGAALGEGGDFAGLGLFDFELLDASGLGEQSAGMRMVMDLSQFAAAFAGDGDVPAVGVEFDMYMFTRGGRMLMLMVMRSSDHPLVVDGKALAEIMDGRAQEAF